MLAPVSSQIATEFGTTNSVLIAMFTSVFVLAYGMYILFHLYYFMSLTASYITAFGPLVLAPLSEIYGRSIILQLANLIYLVFNLACGFARNSVELIIFRLIRGLGGSAPIAVYISHYYLCAAVLTQRIGVRRSAC